MSWEQFSQNKSDYSRLELRIGQGVIAHLRSGLEPEDLVVIQSKFGKKYVLPLLIVRTYGPKIEVGKAYDLLCTETMMSKIAACILSDPSVIERRAHTDWGSKAIGIKRTEKGYTFVPMSPR